MGPTGKACNPGWEKSASRGGGARKTTKPPKNKKDNLLDMSGPQGKKPGTKRMTRVRTLSQGRSMTSWLTSARKCVVPRAEDDPGEPHEPTDVARDPQEQQQEQEQRNS